MYTCTDFQIYLDTSSKGCEGVSSGRGLFSILEEPLARGCWLESELCVAFKRLTEDPVATEDMPASLLADDGFISMEVLGATTWEAEGVLSVTV